MPVMRASWMFLTALFLLHAGAAGAAGNPVSKVVTLLENLAAKIDSELDEESSLYESYVCWAKKVIAENTASNEEAQSRVDSLKQYVADLNAGRIVLTSEGGDVTGEIATLSGDLEKAADLRSQENDDYKAASEENDKGLKALNSAVKEMEKGMKSKAKAKKLLSFRSRVQQTVLESESVGFGSRSQEARELEEAVRVGKRWLKPADALFLERVLSGEVPNVDWKKLNRKADFKNKYNARSVKILGTIRQLLENFGENKDDLDAREKDAQTSYDKLKKSKSKQLDAAQKALTDAAVEKGAAAVSRADSKAEIKALEDQIQDNNKENSNTQKALDKKEKEYKDRKGLRLGEIEAINQALGVIHSDEARDLFKRQTSFVQVSEVTSTVVDEATLTAAAQASAAVRDAAHASGDMRLAALAARITLSSSSSLLSSGLGKPVGKFEKVLASIDKMMKELDTDGKTDKKDKESCEDEREDNTKDSADLSRDIDELSDGVTKLQNEVDQKNKEISQLESDVNNKEQAIADAEAQRDREHKAWLKSDADDTAAITLLKKAANILKTYNKDNFALMQARTADTQDSDAPQTWGGDYKGAQKESGGIIQILGVITSDTEEDQKERKATESADKKACDKFVKDTKASVKKANKAISDRETEKLAKQKEIKRKTSTSNAKKGSLAETIKAMKAAAPGCDFLLTNFKVRTTNRKLEMDGLKKATAILKVQNAIRPHAIAKAKAKLMEQRKAARDAAAAKAKQKKAALAKAKAR